MKQHPILFSTEMIKAILEGRKTMTRRIMKHSRPIEDHELGFPGELQESPNSWRPVANTEKLEFPDAVYPNDDGRSYIDFRTTDEDASFMACIKFPYGQVGDILWVRETFASIMMGGENGMQWGYVYKSDDDFYKDTVEDWEGWKPSIHMPKEACRLYLEITDIRVERLQDICTLEAISEGIQPLLQSRSQMIENGGPIYRNYMVHPKLFNEGVTAIESFMSLWSSINGTESALANPWVWVIEFKRTENPLLT